jgi:hypothetical protein
MSMSVVLINGKQVIFATSFAVRDDQDVVVDHSAPPYPFKCVIRFTAPPAGSQPVSAAGSWTTLEGVVRFIFSGWDNVLGTVLEDQRIGEIEGREVSFQMVHRKVGSLNDVTLSLLLGAKP